MTTGNEKDDIVASIKNYLRQEQLLFGNTMFPEPMKKTKKQETPAVAAELVLSKEQWNSSASLAELNEQICTCTKCVLGSTRTKFVFGVGDPNADLLVIGEAPGADEDAQGEPFVGRAGQLLNKILESVEFKREEVYIANILKCRPPGNRDPAPEEKALCTPYLDRQIELLDPEVVIALGTHAAQHLLRTELSIGRLRGKIHAFGRRKLIATYHPAYLLRSPGAKKDCWQDIQLAMRELGLAPPPRPTPPPDPAR